MGEQFGVCFCSTYEQFLHLFKNDFDYESITGQIQEVTVGNGYPFSPEKQNIHIQQIVNLALELDIFLQLWQFGFDY